MKEQREKNSNEWPEINSRAPAPSLPNSFITTDIIFTATIIIIIIPPILTVLSPSSLLLLLLSLEWNDKKSRTTRLKTRLHNCCVEIHSSEYYRIGVAVRIRLVARKTAYCGLLYLSNWRSFNFVGEITFLANYWLNLEALQLDWNCKWDK